MKQITLNLNKSFQRPVIRLPKFHGLEALLDTGAVYPIWMVGKERIERIHGEKIRDVIHFGGLGGTATGSLYKIPLFQMGDLLFPNMNIIVHDSNFVVPLLLPATMFRHLIYEIDDYHHILNITIPETESNVRSLTIKDSNGRIVVACTSAK